jgi:hypothetical protein
MFRAAKRDNCQRCEIGGTTRRSKDLRYTTAPDRRTHLPYVTLRQRGMHGFEDVPTSCCSVQAGL